MSDFTAVHCGSSGHKFMLDEDTPALVVGPGGCRTVETVPLRAGNSLYGHIPQMTFQPTEGIVIAWWFKTEWHLDSLSNLISSFPMSKWSEGWTEEVQKAITNRDKYVS